MTDAERPWRLYCNCGFRGEDNAAMNPICPQCGSGMRIDRDERADSEKKPIAGGPTIGEFVAMQELTDAEKPRCPKCRKRVSILEFHPGRTEFWCHHCCKSWFLDEPQLGTVGGVNRDYPAILSDAEKLQKLIEIAEGQGFWSEWDDFQVFETSCTVNTQRTESVGREIWGQYRLEEILFDHEFIKALCRAKYGPDHEDLKNFRFEDPMSVVLTELALSTDRIGYLWSEFGSTLPSS